MLSRTALKYIAVIAMLCDHIAYIFIKIPELNYVLRTFGRLTAPIMCYFIAQGYEHTRSKPKYALRLFIFALISQIPFSLAFNGKISLEKQSMIFTLFAGLMAIWACDAIKVPVLNYAVAILIAHISYNADWAVVGALWCLAFWIFRNDKARQMLAYSAVTTVYLIYKYFDYYASRPKSLYFFYISFALYLAVPLLLLYDGKKEKRTKFFVFSKWFVYVFYPLHLLVLYLIKVCL